MNICMRKLIRERLVIQCKHEFLQPYQTWLLTATSPTMPWFSQRYASSCIVERISVRGWSRRGPTSPEPRSISSHLVYRFSGRHYGYKATSLWAPATDDIGEHCLFRIISQVWSETENGTAITAICAVHDLRLRHTWS